MKSSLPELSGAEAAKSHIERRPDGEKDDRKSLHISLKAGQRIYINGAVLKADRKVGLELLNDATFLLPQHVMAPEEATTPLRRLYCAIQSVLIEPTQPSPRTAQSWRGLLAEVVAIYEATAIRDGLDGVSARLESGQLFEAMRSIRQLLALEGHVLTELARKSAQPS
jgi:flagellar protein FlbT